MNRPKATRLGLSLMVTIVAAIAAFAPSAFGITTEASTVYGSTVPGAHTDYTIIQKFEYGNGTEPTGSTGANQDLKKWIVDSPAGLAGNPNAIPYADRCNPAAFDPSGVMSSYVALGACPDSAQVGDATVYLVPDADTPTGCTPNPMNPYYPLDCRLATAYMPPMVGKIYILQTDPEVPTTLGTLFTSASYQDLPNPPFPIACTASPTCPLQPKTKSILAPVTNQSDTYNGDDGDFRIRTIPDEYSAKPAALLPTGLGYPSWNVGGMALHIARIDQHLYGMADPNDNFGTAGQGDTPFLTMPLRCDNWDSKSYAIDYANPSGGSTAMDPENPGDDNYQTSNTDSEAPDCSGALPALNATGSATITTGERGANPGLKVTIADPTAVDDDQPKKVSVTLPSTITNDTDSLVNVCSIAERDAENCPASTKVGTATVKTPLISAGLTGTVYKTTGTNGNLPNLSIFVDGAIKFRLDATNEFTGSSFNQIKSTFDNLPQSPFTEFTVNIDGGASDSLLLNRTCPTDGSAPDDGPITFAINGYTGAASSSSSGVGLDPCYGVSKPSNLQYCQTVTKKLQVSPKGLVAVNNIANVKLFTGAKTTSMNKRATDSSSPHKFKITLKKDTYKKGKTYYYLYKVEYKDGKIVKTETGKFKTCK